MSIYPTKSYPVIKGLSEFEILKASHKFLREDTDSSQNKDNENKEGVGAGAIPSARKKAWEDQLAEKYYESLYREFAVCDLKHYKSGNFALRWRTETEVLSGAGESTCGNTRCKYHFTLSSSSNKVLGPKRKKAKEPQLTTLELPFAYIEHGEPKSALVKVVLCTRCVKKLMWKRRKDKGMKEHGADLGFSTTMGGVSEDDESEEEKEDRDEKAESKGTEKEKEKERIRNEEDPRRMHATAEIKERSRGKNRQDERDNYVEKNGLTTREPHFRRRNSRSRSPRRHFDSHSQSYSSSRNSQSYSRLQKYRINEAST